MSAAQPDEDAEYTPQQPPSLNGVYERSRQSFHLSKPEITQQDGESAASSAEQQLDEEAAASDGRLRSITNQLAQTAVGVREMSKQLARDNHLVSLTREMAIWLMTIPRENNDRGLIVYVDAQLRHSKRFDVARMQAEHPEIFEPIRPQRRMPEGRNMAGEGQLRYWTADLCCSAPHLFDFVVTLGGDGTVLFCSWLFQTNVPPVIPFSLGSLGFLTPFNFDEYKTSLGSAVQNGVRLNMRMRFRATVYRAIPPSDPGASRYRRKAIKSRDTGEIIMRNIEEDGWHAIEVAPTAREGPADTSNTRPHKDKVVHCFGTRPVETFEILNDLVVDRGPSPFVSMLEVFADNNHLTTSQADGLCISTPTGSTAYSLSAGGSLVHPEIPAILITPICPHTLSFRPMLLPDSMELRISVPYHSRSNAWASFDGRGRIEIQRGDHIKVTASPYPFPTVMPEDQPSPWFDSVSRTLNWNQRQKQKSFVMVEENVPAARGAENKASAPRQSVDRIPVAEEDDRRSPSPSSSSDSENDVPEDFDIDDHSTTGSRVNTWDQSLASGATPTSNTAIQREFMSAVQPMTSMSSSTSKVAETPASLPPDAFTPDRFGSAGPPHAPSPLSRRHLAAVDFRLQDALKSGDTKAQPSPDVAMAPTHSSDSQCPQAIVVYGHDDTDDSEESDAP